MSRAIGKVIATEKNPSTMEEFYFWTKPDLILNPFDVVKVKHINSLSNASSEGSITYGVIEEISHITDTASFLAEYISNDFGDVETNPMTYRIGMNYVKARIISNTENIYTPVLSGSEVCTASKSEISDALGLSEIKHPVPCGFLEMYQGTGDDKVKLCVNVDSRYLIGPEGAHLNISGISGLASKTSYAMFLMKAIQDKCLTASVNEDSDNDEDVAFVIFNVKGKDLLAIDQQNDFLSEEQKEKTFSIYEEMGMSKKPFQNVHYYYPFSDRQTWNTYMEQNSVESHIGAGKAFMYQFEYEKDKENLDLLFANMDDPNMTMEACLSYISSDKGPFGNISNWGSFLDKLGEYTGSGNTTGDKDISVLSWRKFRRIVSNIIKDNRIFGTIKDESRNCRLDDALRGIKKNEVHVIDIAKLSDSMQCFVFGSVIKTIYDLKLSVDSDSHTPKKIIVFIDELNKYASSDSPKSSQILKNVLDIAERGRSLGIILFGAEQFKSAIHQRVTGNCATFAYGRTNAIELAKSDYKFIPSVYKSMMTRLKQGEYIIQNPVFSSLLNVKFPLPIYKQFKS